MKTKTCKRCNKVFSPYTSIEKFCSSRCMMASQKEKEKEKRKLVKMKKAVSISALTKKADLIFASYIRRRDSIATTGSPDRCACVTCGNIVDNIQCGHFQTRANRSVRWLEQNSNGQCPKCNGWGSGEQYEHGKAIDRKYGEGTADRIVLLASEPTKVTRDMLEGIIVDYKKKLEEL